MKKMYIFLTLVFISTSLLNAFSNVRKYKYSDVTTWYFTCNDKQDGSVNYSYDTKYYYANSKGIYPHYSSMESAASAECKHLSSKKNHTYGYIKKGAIIFSKQTGENSIEWALSYVDPNNPNRGNYMKFAELRVIYGELPKNGTRKKIRLYKKYTKPNLSSSYWKIKDGSKTKYIAEEDIE